MNGRKTIPVHCLSLAVLLLDVAILGEAQSRVDNPGRALSKNAGRAVRLEEVMRIRDDGTSAIFRLPRKLALGPDGSLYFHDFAEGDRVYRYGPEGKLIFKVLKTGQGPGESQHVSNFFLDGDRIRVQAWSPPKIMDFGIDGRYLKEIPTESTHGLHSLFALEGKIYGLRDEIPHSQAIFGTGSVETPYSLYELSADFKIWKKLQDFPVRHAIKNRSWVRLDMIDATAAWPFIYIVHTAEYRVDQFDLRSGRVERLIRRTYDRPRGEPSEDEDYDPEAKRVISAADIPAFDILEIHAVAGRLWVFTSTMKKNGNGRLVDVFDAEGRFVDSFRLEFPDEKIKHNYSKGLISGDGFLFVPEQDEDGLVSIGKYRILGSVSTINP